MQSEHFYENKIGVSDPCMQIIEMEKNRNGTTSVEILILQFHKEERRKMSYR